MPAAPGAMPDLLAARARLGGDAVALEEPGGEALDYAALDARASAAAALLAARGIGEGDRVAILCRNRIAFFELLFGCARLGAVLVPLNWRMPPAELGAIVADCAPALLLAGTEDEMAAAGLGPPVLALDGAYPAERDAAPPVAIRSLWPAGGLWYLLYTSGTTGRPKGVMCTFGMALANHLNIVEATGLGAGDRLVNFLPLYHTAGINLHTLPALIAGARVLVLPGFDPDAMASLFADRRIDLFFGVPPVYRALFDRPAFRAAPLGHVRHWASGGAPLPPALAEEARALGIRLCNGMGMTETGPTAFLADPADAWSHIGAIGRPRLLCAVRLTDADGRDVADGEVGEVLFAGPGVTPGYWRDAEASRAAFTADGWLRSGDLARRGADGIYHVAGRAKEMFVSGGENVYPAEVEATLLAHPAIAEAAVLPVPDPRWGEAGRALLRIAPGHAAPETAALAAFCRERIAAYKVPAIFEIVDDFPRTTAGKIRKHLLAGGTRT